MGSLIHLSVGHLEVSWGKGNLFINFCDLFQGESDIQQIPVYYIDNDVCNSSNASDIFKTRYEDKVAITYREGLAKPLKQVLERIELLGFTLARCEKTFDELKEMHNFDDEVLSFRSFSQALKDIDVDKLPLDYPEHLCEFGKFVRDEIIPKFGVLRSIETSYVVSVSEMLENYNPYALLRLISENPYTLNLPVVWDFNGIVDDGYARRDEFVCNLDDRKKFLVVTEGSSDASIVKHAFDVLKPYITDFFKFVDMEKGYPFSGTGNLFKFVQGLISIGVHNDIIVLLDNDAEGNATLQRCLNLDIPKNMRIIKLPDLGQFENFKTVGPNGISYADINGKAASIECYLDLHDDALVRWRSYNDSLDVYQGALISKDKYKKDFLDIKENDLNYNYEKITMVLHLILDTAKSMRESM